MPTLRSSEHSAAERRRGNITLCEWTGYQRPCVERMLIAALDFASAANDYRNTQLWAGDVTRHDFSTVDNLGGMLDQLCDMIGAARKRLDDLGINPDLADLDTSDLIKAHTEAKVRADARLPNQQGPALLEALRASLTDRSA